MRELEESAQSFQKIMSEWTKAEATEFNIHLLDAIYEVDNIAFVCGNGEVDFVVYDV